jgi:hypothetical protein
MSKPKSAVDFDQAADRPDRPKPTNRIPTPYAVVEAHGVPIPGVTVDQPNRKHEPASEKEGIAAGAIKTGEIGEDRSVSYETGAESAARRATHVLTKRQETEAIFNLHRKSAPGFRTPRTASSRGPERAHRALTHNNNQPGPRRKRREPFRCEGTSFTAELGRHRRLPGCSLHPYRCSGSRYLESSRTCAGRSYRP